jgi:hypothetical protein
MVLFFSSVSRVASVFSGWRFGCVRPSSRSRSGWVAVLFFPSLRLASRAALLAGSALGRSCLVRCGAGWFRLSVPVAWTAPWVDGAWSPCGWFSPPSGGSGFVAPAPPSAPVSLGVTAHRR